MSRKRRASEARTRSHSSGFLVCFRRSLLGCPLASGTRAKTALCYRDHHARDACFPLCNPDCRSVCLSFASPRCLSFYWLQPSGHFCIPKEPSALFGVGSHKRKVFVSSETKSDMKRIADQVFAWAQGWFSARNSVGSSEGERPRTVGGSLSGKVLRAMLVADFEELPETTVFLVV